MHSAVAVVVALFYCYVINISPTHGQVQTTTPFSLKVKGSFQRRECITKENQTGICIQKSTCNNAHEIEIGGRIAESELRMGASCNIQKGEWCCSFKDVKPTGFTFGANNNNSPAPVTTATPNTGQKKAKQCLASDANGCPWFVKIYRSGQDYPFCVGAMIGSNAILTTATCDLQAQGNFLWARVPSSSNPEANYTITARLRHPNYNSGTRLNDLALFSTLANINWGSDGPKGACISPDLNLGGECVAANLNEYDDLNMEPLFVTSGACTARANVADAMCGNAVFTNSLADGAPIMCQKNNYYVLSGITKTSYPGDDSKALLGNLDYAWLIKNLKETAGLSEADFLFSLNYN